MSEPNKKNLHVPHNKCLRLVNTHKFQFLRSSRKRVVSWFVICFKIYFRVCVLLQNIYQNAQPQFFTVLGTTFLAMAEMLMMDH